MMQRILIVLIFLMSWISPVHSSGIDELKKKIEDITEALEKDAIKYETLYPNELKLIVKYRIGWAWLVSLSDNRYSLRVLAYGIDRNKNNVDYLSYVEPAASAGGMPPDINIVSSAIVRENTVLIALETEIRNKLKPCSDTASEDIMSLVPLSSIISIQAPDFGTFPSLHHDPTLRIKFIIDDDGNVSLAPDAYAGEATNPSGKHTVPGIASTLSGALVLFAAEKAGVAGGASSFSAGFAAAVIAGLVYFTVSHIEDGIEQGELADAVAAMNRVINRIYQAQKIAYLEMEDQYVSFITEVCRASFQSALEAQLVELENLAVKRQEIMDRYSSEMKRLGEVKSDESWDEVECAIFGCGEDTQSVLTLPLDRLIDHYVNNTRP
ncbi:hypothetical protein RAH32_18280 [Paracoccus sp. WLY502]|uniref:hypothetical protein n=1 Tax=Paracoccus yibinensis TaxID=3068891 RepID=UPI0027964917|nr:hypothetical protein [Paracoccus sp. WLY502]MDQ1902371.1 hypothetical protein [Paracoccus sp. WLY502]